MRRAMSLVMAMLFPLSLLSAETGAVAVPSGRVTVNGMAVSRSTPLFAEDRISTTDGTMVLSLQGSIVQVVSNSSVTFAPQRMIVSSGGLKVSTTRGFGGQFRNLTFQPAGTDRTVYTLAERDGKVLIASLEGTLTITDGHGQMALAANHAVSIPLQDASSQNTSQEQPSCKKDDKKCKAAGAAGAAGAGAGASGGASVSTAVAVGIAAAAAAAGVAASFGIAVATEAPASPSGP